MGKPQLRWATTALQHSKAYKDFARKAGYRKTTVATGADFLSLPVSDKNSFIKAYSLPDLLPYGKMPAVAFASSGSSGQPTFWFRNTEQERVAGKIHEQLVRETWGISQHQSTLVIVCFSMGVWVAGNYTAASFRAVADQGYAMTVVTPGLEQRDILHVLTTLAPQFHTVIMAGYPPFIMDMVVAAKKHGTILPQRLRILTAGDSFSEPWRDAMLREINQQNMPHSVISIYGSADAGVLGFETPLSIAIRRKSLQAPKLYQALFGAERTQPALVQYDPRYIYFESIGEELVLTAATAVPLIRYNIHDIGAVAPSREMATVLEAQSMASLQRQVNNQSLPFIIKRGRTDVAVTFYALNIYPEHFRSGLEDKRVARWVSGNFASFNANRNQERKQELHVIVELAPKIKPTKNLTELVRKSVVDNLLKHNIEYRKLYGALGSKALPHVRIVSHNHPELLRRTGLVAVAGKKPRIIIV